MQAQMAPINLAANSKNPKFSPLETTERGIST